MPVLWRARARRRLPTRARAPLPGRAARRVCRLLVGEGACRVSRRRSGSRRCRWRQCGRQPCRRRLTHGARSGRGLPACQLLVYPPVDRRSHWPSVDSFSEGFFLTKSSIDWFDEQYGMHDAERSSDWRRNPLVSSSHAGLPPTYVATAGFDPLRDEGEAYAAALARAGTPVSLRRFPEQLHGFVNMVGISRTARDAVLEMAGALRVLLHQSSLALAMPSSACALSESVLGRSDCAACRRVRP